MREYEEKKYEQWRDYVEGILPGLLKRNLLTKPAPTTAVIAVAHNDGEGNGGSSASNHAMQGANASEPFTVHGNATITKYIGST